MRTLVIATGLVCLTWAEPAFACTCVPRRASMESYRAWFNQFDGAVFQGTVVETEVLRDVPALPGPPSYPLGDRKITIRVERHWKGVRSASMVIYTSGSGSMCGVTLVKGTTAIVAARRENDRLNVNLCTQQFIAQNRTQFLEAIGAGSAASSFPPR